MLTVTITRDTVPTKWHQCIDTVVRARSWQPILPPDREPLSFKLKYGKYHCIVKDRSQNMTTYYITFDESRSKILLDLNTKPLLEI